MSVVASDLPCARGIAEAAFLFVAGSAAMPDEPNCVIQPSVFQLVLKEMHGAEHD